MMQLVDEKNNTHFLTEKFGEDGQGVLYKTKNASIIIRHSAGREADRPIYDEIKLLPVSSVENILLPTYYLKEPEIGYALNVPEGFVSLTTILRPSFKDNDKEFYIKTGGLKRRLDILMSLAKILAGLHSLPVMYGSMSADRVLISADSVNNAVYLLYSTQISYIMSFKPEQNADPYAAPETGNGTGSSVLSDVYAYAALAYDLLTLSGSITSTVNDEMQLLFERALKNPDKEKRPKIMDFYKLFARMSDLLLVCKNCHSDIFYNAPCCPNCSSPLPKLLKAVIYDRISRSRVERGIKILELVATRQCFWNYHTENLLLSSIPQPAIDCVLNISSDKKLHLIFKNLMDRSIIINSKTIQSDECTVVALPFTRIDIFINLHTATQRCIEMVMI